jgi:hypothetical protein
MSNLAFNPAGNPTNPLFSRVIATAPARTTMRHLNPSAPVGDPASLAFLLASASTVPTSSVAALAIAPFGLSYYVIGQIVPMAAAFAVGNVPADPDSVTLEVERPDGSIVTLTPTHDGTGAYHADYLVGVVNEGLNVFRWVGTGAAADAAEGYFIVEYSDFTA